MFNSKNFQREIFCRSREIFVEAGSFDNYKALTIMLLSVTNTDIRLHQGPMSDVSIETNQIEHNRDNHFESKYSKPLISVHKVAYFE